MAFGKKKEEVAEEETTQDPTGWLIDSEIANFVLMNTNAIKYMCMFGYAYLHGHKLFGTFPSGASPSYKLISLVLKCTGGGTLVPIFINSLPVVLVQDAYPIAISASFLLHQYVPIMREVMSLSPILMTAVIFLYETFRAYVVVKLTSVAGETIPASEFSFAIFGPIFCGTIAGCGGAFLPLDKGLEPIKEGGLAQPMLSAFIAATFYHLFISTSLSDGVIDAPKKAHVTIAVFFICYHLYTATMENYSSAPAPAPAPKTSKTSVKRESRKNK